MDKDSETFNKFLKVPGATKYLLGKIVNYQHYMSCIFPSKKRTSGATQKVESVGGTQLCYASSEGSVGMVKALVELLGVPVDAMDKCSRTPLHYAALKGRRNIAVYLLNKGAKVDARDKTRGYTSLHIAAQNNDIELVKILVWHKANVNATAAAVDASSDITYENWTALHIASEAGYADMCRCLCDLGAYVNARGQNDKTPLCIASTVGSVDAVRSLLEKGAMVDPIIPGWPTALTEAIQGGHLDVVKVLLQHGADPNRTLEGGAAPLVFAALRGRVEIMRCLIKHGADVNKRHPDKGFTAMMSAAETGHPEAIELLIAKGADVNAKKTGGDKFSVLHFSAKHGRLSCAELLLKQGANVHAVDANGNTPLIYACHDGHVEVARLLLKNGADVNAHAGIMENGLESTPLNIAGLNNQFEVAAMLLTEFGVNPFMPIPDKKQ